MNSAVLKYIENLEGKKLAIKQLHWDAKNMSQHKLCDDIADRIFDFQDQVSEVEQSMSGKLPLNEFKPSEYEVIGLKPFVEDVIADAKGFLKELEGMGDDYVGMKSDCESFISDMQRNLYLVNFTLKENLKKSILNTITEGMYKNVPSDDEEFDKAKGRHPKTIKARINRIYNLVKKYGISSRLYKDENWQAVDDYIKAIESLGCEVRVWCENGGYTDYDPSDNMPRSKEYKIEITYEDGMVVGGYIKCMAAGTVSNPFARYDTTMVLWPKPKRELSVESITNTAMSLLTEKLVNSISRFPKKSYLYFMAEVEVDDVENEQSRYVELPFKCTVRDEKPEPEVNYGGALEFNDMQLDVDRIDGIISQEEAVWVIKEWMPQNMDYLEDVAEEEYVGEMENSMPDMMDRYHEWKDDIRR